MDFDLPDLEGLTDDERHKILGVMRAAERDGSLKTVGSQLT